MENYDRQQDGGYSATQQQQGFAEGSDAPNLPGGEWYADLLYAVGNAEEDAAKGGYEPEDGDDPGSEYEGGYEPVFTWGGVEDDVVAEEPVDATAADSSGATPPLEPVGRSDATGDPEIETYSNDTGQAGYDDDGQEPNDAPDPWGGKPPSEYVEQAGADSGDDEIEMTGDEVPPEDVGRAGTDADGQEPNDAPDPSGGTPPEDGGQAGDDAGDPKIEMYSDDAGQVGAGAGDGKIEMSPEDVWENAKRKMAAYEQELSGFNTYDELVDHYKYTYFKLYERHPDLVDRMLYRTDLSKNPALDTYEELKDATKKLLAERDAQHDYEQQLEARYAKDLAANPDFQHYEKLADYYKDFHMKSWGSEPSWAGLDTYEKLKIAVFEAWRYYDSNPQDRKGEQLIEEKDESRTDDSVELPVIDSGKDAPEIEMPLDYVGRTGVNDDGQEPNDAPDPWGGTPPPEYIEQAGTDDAGDAEIEMSSDDAGRAGDPLKKYRQQLEVRYGKELAQDGGLLLYEVEIDGLNSALDYYIRSGQGTWETHVRIATKIHELEQKRDSYLEKIKDYYDRDGFREEQDDHHREDFHELSVIGSDKDPASEPIEDAGETVGNSYGYGDYVGW